MIFEKPPRRIPKPRGRRGPSVQITPRDLQIMKYIWDWKIASTSSIHEAINQNASPYSTYKILDRLEKNGFLECDYEFTDRFYVWCLSEAGFHAIKAHLGELKEDGFRSENHRHDRLVQAFQLGEWSKHQLKNATFFTEQNLRRRDVSNYPDWVPRGTDHRPDGYSKILGHKRSWTIAYEVELSIKNVQKYEGILRFYQMARMVDRVIWLVDSDEVKETILRAKQCIKEDSTNFHVFVNLKDFRERGWDAEVRNERSERLFSMREKYQGICGETISEILGKLKGTSLVTAHLANQKVIGKSRS